MTGRKERGRNDCPPADISFGRVNDSLMDYGYDAWLCGLTSHDDTT